MATYPNGVYAPVSKAAGNTIQASFFNDPEAEITAVEDALKNGIAHPVTINGALTVSTGGVTVSTGSVNIGGPSSLATLSVSGGSTFAGPVTFSSGVTFAGAFTFSSGLSVSTGVIRQNSLPCWILRSSAMFVTNDTVGVGIQFTGQDSLTGDIGHSTAVNSSRVTINTTGVYQIEYQQRTDFPAGGTPWVTLYLNDTTALVRSRLASNPNNLTDVTLAFTTKIRIGSTGFLTVRFASQNGNSTAGSTSTAQDNCFFSGHFVG